MVLVCWNQIETVPARSRYFVSFRGACMNQFDRAGIVIREIRDVLFLGPPGTRKSFLVQALGYQAIKAGFTVLYRSIFGTLAHF